MNKHYEPVRSNDGWVIKKNASGPMPRALQGVFTEYRIAERVLRQFLTEAENRRIQKLPAAQRAKVEADKKAS